MLHYNLIDELTDYYVIISADGKPLGGPANVKLVGILDGEEISFSNSSNWDQATVGNIFGKVLKGGARGFVGLFTGEAGKSLLNYETFAESIKGYSGSGNSSFSISMNIFREKFGNPKSYREIEKQLGMLTQPNLEDMSKLTNALKSDLYTPSSEIKIQKGQRSPFDGQLIHVQIGDWFLMTGLYCTNVTRNYSTITDLDGQPLYLKVSFSFESSRVLSAEEIAKCFKETY